MAVAWYSELVMKLLKVTVLTAFLGLSGVASAELVANSSLNVPRYDSMQPMQLLSQAKTGNQQAQFSLAKRY